MGFAEYRQGRHTTALTPLETGSIVIHHSTSGQACSRSGKGVEGAQPTGGMGVSGLGATGLYTFAGTPTSPVTGGHCCRGNRSSSSQRLCQAGGGSSAVDAKCSPQCEACSFHLQHCRSCFERRGHQSVQSGAWQTSMQVGFQQRCAIHPLPTRKLID